MTYKPLPDNLTICPSTIEGLGLFTVEKITANKQLGMLHYYVTDTEILRTPLGGFINHSENSNCYKATVGLGSGSRTYLVTKRKIKANEELTLTYDLYKPQA